MQTFRNQDQDVVAQVWTSSPGRRRRRPSAEVWGVCEKTPLPRGTRRRPGARVVAHAQMQSSQYMRDALDIDGPARHTRAAIKRALDMNLANEAGPSNPRCGYEIQLPSNSTKEHRILVDDTDSH